MKQTAINDYASSEQLYDKAKVETPIPESEDEKGVL